MRVWRGGNTGQGSCCRVCPPPWGKGSLGLSPQLTERPGRCVSLGKGSVIYDSSFDLFKEIGHLCRLCKAIAGNSELVKPGGAQCLPSGMCGRGRGPCEVTAHLIALGNMCLVFGCLYWSVPVWHSRPCANICRMCTGLQENAEGLGWSGGCMLVKCIGMPLGGALPDWRASG